ncbi:NUDIX domain-containing protein [Sphingomonas sp.]|jgi:8-oxo-dGTP pyrophosphatase MutT (NUDIX family)|uniref:NUDIX domain-containing protein n=1 Tax=Sphingomonas sp. TaxID=28214 RepID=UPI002DE420D7|nr:NUDIX domain-containing protein [Sphingomonas sp.]HEV2567908.1 NUDIX domain-containing protein [Sphingomonas sp.]
MHVKAMTVSVALLHPSEPRVLCVRHPSLGRWMFVGGHLEAGETPPAAALREVAEEVGLSAELGDASPLPVWRSGGNRRLPHPLAIIEESLPASPGEAYVDIVFAGVSRTAEFDLQREVLEAGWFDLRGVQALDTTYPVKELTGVLLGMASSLRAQVSAGRP